VFFLSLLKNIKPREVKIEVMTIGEEVFTCTVAAVLNIIIEERFPPPTIIKSAMFPVKGHSAKYLVANRIPTSANKDIAVNIDMTGPFGL
jgi:hypothetical protein